MDSLHMRERERERERERGRIKKGITKKRGENMWVWNYIKYEC